MISEDRVQKALTYLSMTDKECADAKVEVARLTYKCELERQQVFLASTGSIKEREALAEVSEAVQRAEEERIKAIGLYEHIRAKRATEEWVIETWRSLNANRRQGNIT